MKNDLPAIRIKSSQARLISFDACGRLLQKHTIKSRDSTKVVSAELYREHDVHASIGGTA